MAIESVYPESMRNAALWALLLALPAAAQEVPRDFRLTMSRSGCFGTCPVYSVTIDADGSVTFGGRKFTAASSERKTIPPDAVKELVIAVKRIGFFALDDYVPGATCPEQWTDYPTVSVAVRMKGKSRVLRHDHGCRGFNREQELMRFEDAIDEVSGIAAWRRYDREIEASREMAASITHCWTAADCDRGVRELKENAVLLYESEDRSKSAVICRDGGVHIQSRRFAFISAVDARLTAKELALAEAAGAKREAGSAVALTSDPSLASLVSEVVLAGRARTIRFEPEKPRLAMGQLRHWIANDVVPEADLTKRAITAEEWQRIRPRLDYTSASEYPLLATPKGGMTLRLIADDAPPPCVTPAAAAP